MRKQRPHKLVVKGVTHPEDARRLAVADVNEVRAILQAVW